MPKGDTGIAPRTRDCATVTQVRLFGSADRARRLDRPAPPRAGFTDPERGIAEVLESAEHAIGEAVDAAAAAAERIRRDVDHHLRAGGPGAGTDRQRVAADLGSSLADRAQELSREADELTSILGRARRALDVGQAPTLAERAAQDEDSGPAPQKPVKTPPFAARRRAVNGVGPAAARQPSSTAIRLIATQMTVAGSGRGEIEERLRSEFGVEDPSAIVSDVLQHATTPEGS